MKMKRERKMRFEIIEDVEKSDSNGGWIKVKVSENVDDCVDSMMSRVVVLSFDFGDSLGGIEIEDSEENIEDVFSEECCEMLWKMEFVG
jgi:hypothetical protein